MPRLASFAAGFGAATGPAKTGGPEATGLGVKGTFAETEGLADELVDLLMEPSDLLKADEANAGFTMPLGLLAGASAAFTGAVGATHLATCGAEETWSVVDADAARTE